MKQISETIDGSIKDIIQLKTLDNSLEYSQMFDALEDTPREFQLKLVDALNSLGETMQVPPTEAFNKVLCKSDDGNEDVTKKLYNWWRAFFEVLGKCEKIPNDRKTEFNQKIDDLMAEIMKAGDTEATDEEEPVMESSDDEFGYQQATKDDEDKMLADMDFAVQHIGEVANKVKVVVNFINPYCGTSVNEGHMSKPGRYGIGDHVLYKGEECVVTDVDEDLRNDEEIYQVSRDSDKVDGLSFNDWATWDELEPLEGFTENIGKFNFHVGDKVKVIGRRLASKGWIGVVSSVDKSKPGLPYTVDFEGRESGEYAPDELTPAKGFTEEEKNTMKFKKIDERIGGGDSDKWVSMNDYVGEEFKESNDKKQFGEAKVVVDANDVWDVLDLLDNDIAHNELTDLINSHLRTEDEIMDAIDELCGETITQKELNTLLSGRMATLVDYLGLDVEEYENMGNFVDSDKPTSVELESGETGETKKVTLYVDWDDDGAGLDNNVVIDVPAEIADSEESGALYDYVSDWIDHQDFCVNDWAITDIEGLMDEGSGDEIKGGEVKDGEKQVTQDGDTETLVAGEGDNKKPVCEMTIEQEVDDPWKLSEMLWSQGKENLEDLLRSELVGEEDIMQMLEDSELHNLTSINDAFAFDFPSILDSLGLDGEAWSQNLEFKRKGDDSEGDSKKDSDDGDMVDWFKTKLEKLPDEYFDKKKK